MTGWDPYNPDPSYPPQPGGAGGVPPGGYLPPPQFGAQPVDPLVSPDYSGWWSRATTIVRHGWKPLATIQAIGLLLSLLLQAPAGIYLAFATDDLERAFPEPGTTGAQADLKTLVDADVTKHIDPSKQSILTEGLDSATYHVNSSTATTAQIALSTTATAGPDLQADSIKTQVTGKKSGDIKSLLKNDPGVTQVDTHFSPFWVNKAPKPSKLTIIFQKNQIQEARSLDSCSHHIAVLVAWLRRD